MAVFLSDSQVDEYIREPKELPYNWLEKLALRDKRGHRERDLEVRGSNGSRFHIIIRQSMEDPLNFSVILAVSTKSGQMFRLRRYNGKHEHTNTIERIQLNGCHIHQATERYQQLGGKEDMYAEASDRFADIQTAIRYMLKDCGFNIPPSPQVELFEEYQP